MFYFMTAKTHIADFFEDIKSFFTPKLCLVCGRLLGQNNRYLCIHCLNELSFSKSSGQDNNHIERMLRKEIDVECASSLFVYNEGNRNSNHLIHQLKYYNSYEIGIYFGELMGSLIKASGRFENVECIVPVPISVKSLKERGYNQSVAIAEGISKVWGIPLVEDCLIRNDSRRRQTELSYSERAENAKGIYILKNSHFIEGKHVLLVDDIITTGNTIINSVRELQKANINSVSFVSLAASI